MSKFTAKTMTLKGNRNDPESAQHIINFPGGAVEVSRTTDGKYWAHIIISNGWGVEPDGEILGSRIDYTDNLIDIPDAEKVTQIAVLIGIK